MKILYFITKSNWGGAQRYVFDMAISAHSSGHDVAVAAGGNGRLFQELASMGIQTISLGKAKRDISITTDIGGFFEILNLIRKIKPDIVHSNSSKLGFLGSFAARIARVSGIVFTAHGWPFKEDRSKIWKAIIYFISWFTSFVAHKTIVVCNEDLRLGKSMWFVKNKMELIYLGIQPYHLLEKMEARLYLANLAPRTDINAFWFGINAELNHNKGYQYLLEAFVDIDAQLICVSDGEDREMLMQKTVDLCLQDRVHFVGFVSDARKYYCAFDVFVLPSIKEGLPYVLLEAGHAGLPTIASRVGGIPDLLDNAGMLVEPKNVAKLHDTMESMLADATLRKNFSEALHKKITAEFSFNAMITKTKQLYDSLVRK